MQLDAEFNVIKSKLSAYLKTIQNEQISHKLIKDCIRRAIYEPFSTRDISVKGRKVFFSSSKSAGRSHKLDMEM